MWSFLIGIPLLMHGLAHGSGFAAAWTSTWAGFSQRAWLFSDGITLKSPLGRAFGLLWLVAMLGLAGAGLGVLFGQSWWPALAGAVVSLVAILPWWQAVPPGAKAGAVFDLLIVVTLLLWGERIAQ